MKLIAFIFTLPLLLAQAATINVASYGDGTASSANFASAYAAASTGDTILFPASGSATWTSEVQISKAITINGNGTTLTGGATLNMGFFLLYGLTTTQPVRITGFTFNLNNFSGGLAVRGYSIDITQLRIDHNTFHHGNYQIEISGAKGVIDNNWFYNGNNAMLLGGGTRAQADASWASMVPGTNDGMFVEDNHFIVDANVTGVYSQVFDADNGGKIVWRYNTVDLTQDSQTTGTQYFWQNHGNACGGCSSVSAAYWQNDSTARRSPSVMEVYKNTIAGKRLGRLATFRGGSALCFSNTVTSVTYNPGIVMYEEEDDLISQFSPSRTAWPAEDQVHNSFFWANTSNGVDMNSAPATYYTILDPTFIQQDRDYFLHAPEATGGKESFTGANGASGTNPTDGDPYPTQGTMTFSSSGANAYYPYTPYTYPHPLRGERTATVGTLTVRGISTQ